MIACQHPFQTFQKLCSGELWVSVVVQALIDLVLLVCLAGCLLAGWLTRVALEVTGDSRTALRVADGCAQRFAGVALADQVVAPESQSHWLEN